MQPSNNPLLERLQKLSGVELPRGNYRLDTLIATTNMSLVYKAIDNSSRQVVAVKILANERYYARFANEAQIAYGLLHPNIANTIRYDLNGETLEDGTLVRYLVMKYLSGPSLSEKLHQNAERNAPLSERLDLTLSMLRKIAPALEYIHSRRLFHRDIKPSNVLYDRSEPYLIDFGIAKTVPLETDEATVVGADMGTMVGERPGTANYMPPEQWMGIVSSGASDEYALAITVYEILTNRISPFQRAIEQYFTSGKAASSTTDEHRLAIWQQVHYFEQPTPIREYVPELPEAIWLVLRKALEKDTSNRFPAVTDFLRAFEAAAAGQTVPGLDDVRKTQVEMPAIPLGGGAPVPGRLEPHPPPRYRATTEKLPEIPGITRRKPPPESRGSRLPTMLLIIGALIALGIGIVLIINAITHQNGANVTPTVASTSLVGIDDGTPTEPAETNAPTTTPLIAALTTDTASPSPTPTQTVTVTPTSEPTRAPTTAAPTLTPADASPIPTLTQVVLLVTDAPSETFTPTFTPSLTATDTPTDTPTTLPSETPTRIPTDTPTDIPTETLTHTPVPTDTPSATEILPATATWTQVVLPTVTPAVTATMTPTPSVTFTLTPTVTRTATETPTSTPSTEPSPTYTQEQLIVPTVTKPPTQTPTFTATEPPSETPSPTATPSPSATPTPTITPTLTATLTATPTDTPTFTATATETLRVSPTPNYTETYISAAMTLAAFLNPTLAPEAATPTATSPSGLVPTIAIPTLGGIPTLAFPGLQATASAMAQLTTTPTSVISGPATSTRVLPPTQVAQGGTPTPTPTPVILGIVGADAPQPVAMRNAPNGERVRDLPPGVTFDITSVSADSNWVEIRLADGRTGWIPISAVYIVRSGAGREFAVSFRLGPGSEVRVVQRSRDRQWLNIVTESGRAGWINADLVTILELTPEGTLTATPTAGAVLSIPRNTVSYPNGFLLRITRPDVWLRSRPSSDDTTIIATLAQNNIVVSLGRSQWDGRQWWWRVRTDWGAEGWVEQGSLTPG